MGYALFAQRKLVLDNQLNATQLQQTQRSNEQYQLATDSMSLQQKLSSLQTNQALRLQPLYDQLANAGSSAKPSDDLEKGSDEYKAAMDTYYKQAELEMSEINAQISKMQAAFKAEEESINQEIYLVGIKENAIEMEVKRLETQVSTLEKQLEKVEDAEGAAIDRATPQFKAK